jgi:hypothetical protein
MQKVSRVAKLMNKITTSPDVGSDTEEIVNMRMTMTRQQLKDPRRSMSRRVYTTLYTSQNREQVVTTKSKVLDMDAFDQRDKMSTTSLKAVLKKSVKTMVLHACGTAKVTRLLKHAPDLGAGVDGKNTMTFA